METVSPPTSSTCCALIVRPDMYSRTFGKSPGWMKTTRIRFSLKLFLLPRLDSISLAPGQETIMQLSLVRALGIKCPDVTELDFRGSYRGPQHSPLFQEALLELLPSLKRLESLYICNIDAAIFNHIGGLPYFKCLVVTESPEFIIDGQSASRFPALESLNLWSTTPEVGSAIVRTIEHRGLREIGLAFESAFPDVQTTTRLYNSIDATGSHSTLKTLHIEDEAEYNELHIPDEDQFDSYIVGGKHWRFSFPSRTSPRSF
ncbi:hypothetical protein MSAN_01324500 [Mycena sanguinolenta]|uniref:Uncharacterized protein n=1 Tax=Mycena sanguinolenta TaxID=230812 RepID=A0A8H6YFE4_9AGAR|nr:hypothetical protein MSAN_01324500 [Mycena sanguinolenta]